MQCHLLQRRSEDKVLGKEPILQSNLPFCCSPNGNYGSARSGPANEKLAPSLLAGQVSESEALTQRADARRTRRPPALRCTRRLSKHMFLV
jgi:hypothetical protein